MRTDTENKTLASLLSQSSQIIEDLILSDGELTPEIEELISINETQLSTKVDAYNFIMERLDNDHEFFKQKADKLSKIAQGCKKTKDRIKERIKILMQAHGLNELNGQEIRFKLMPTQPSLVIDETKLSDKWKVISLTPDKQRIKESLKSGEVIDGAVLEPSMALRTYVKK